jgi:protein-S-isoprenylcysteine O-methyltransferase Ste14
VFLRHLLAILMLPFVVVVLVPRWLLAGAAPDASVGWRHLAARALGAVVFLVGLSLFAWCLTLFARVGQGTLAPWDPTRRLVAAGPYRHTRNPMITAVVTMLAGEAIFFQSARVAWWMATFAALNHLYFLFLEEPGLVARFGADYERYRAAVPRWLPRMRR